MKQKLIKEINYIIEEYGSFSDGEIEKDSSICHNSMGNIVGLIEFFNKDYADVEIYDTKSSSSDGISSYTVNYKDLTIAALKTILKYCEQYKSIQNEDI